MGFSVSPTVKHYFGFEFQGLVEWDLIIATTFVREIFAYNVKFSIFLPAEMV